MYHPRGRYALLTVLILAAALLLRQFAGLGLDSFLHAGTAPDRSTCVRPDHCNDDEDDGGTVTPSAPLLAISRPSSRSADRLPIYLLAPNPNDTAYPPVHSNATSTPTPTFRVRSLPWRDLTRAWNRTTSYDDLIGHPSASPLSALPLDEYVGGYKRRVVVWIHCGPKVASTTLRGACENNLRKTCGIESKGIEPAGYFRYDDLDPLLRKCNATYHYCVKTTEMIFKPFKVGVDSLSKRKMNRKNKKNGKKERQGKKGGDDEQRKLEEEKDKENHEGIATAGSSDAEVEQHDFNGGESFDNATAIAGGTAAKKFEDVAFLHLFPFRTYDQWAESAMKQFYDRNREKGCQFLNSTLKKCKHSKMELDFRKYGKTDLANFTNSILPRLAPPYSETHILILYNFRELDETLRHLSLWYDIPKLLGSDGNKKGSRPEGTCDERLLDRYHECFTGSLMDLE